jgi:Ser/Thr protein kinase RdoA (MazF antagonist)
MDLAKECAEVYDLGVVDSVKVLEIGYEDFNAVVSAQRDGENKYFLKIFANSRTNGEVEEIMGRMLAAQGVGVSTPEIYVNLQTEEYLTEIKIEGSRFRLCLIKYIDGDDFFSLGHKPDDYELLEIVEAVSKIAKSDFRPKFIYDTWAINNFLIEWEKKKQYLSGDDLGIVEKIVDEFSKFQYEDLPKCFVHGDIMSTNVLKAKADGKIYVIDWSVSNYVPRLNEIAVICGDLALLVGDLEKSVQKVKAAFGRWAELVGADEFEKDSFGMVYRVANAIKIMNTNYEIATGNTSDETMMHLNAGRFGMKVGERL